MGEETMQSIGRQCEFVECWQGQCPNDAVAIQERVPVCDEHADEQCVECGDQATTNCPATVGGFVCGRPVCNEHSCPRHDHSGHGEADLVDADPRGSVEIDTDGVVSTTIDFSFDDTDTIGRAAERQFIDEQDDVVADVVESVYDNARKFRVAVNGIDVIVEKDRVAVPERGSLWEVRSYYDGNNDHYVVSQKEFESGPRADEYFEELLERYNGTEVEYDG